MSSDLQYETNGSELSSNGLVVGNEDSSRVIEAGSGDDDDDLQLFKDLFSFYDAENTGYITTEKFIAITKENIQNWSNEKERIDLWVKKLDPLGLGKIDFKQFAIGMRKLTSGELDGPDDDINHSKPANKSSPYSVYNDTFNEYDTDNSQNNGSTKSGRVNEDFDAATFDDQLGGLVPTGELIAFDEFESSTASTTAIPTNNPLLSSSTGKFEPLTSASENDSESDPFGFDIQVINDHRKSLTAGALFSANDVNLMGSSSPLSSPVKNASIINSKRRTSEMYRHLSRNETFEEHDQDEQSGDEMRTVVKQSSIESYDEKQELIDNYESKIRELTHQREGLMKENQEIMEIVNKLSHENSHLIEKVRELEETNMDVERKLRIQTQSEAQQHQETVNKLTQSFVDEKDNFLIQINSLEDQIKRYKEENVKYQKELNEFAKKSEQDDSKVAEMFDLYNKLKTDYQRVVGEKEQLKKESEKESLETLERLEEKEKEIERLTDELRELNSYQKTRSNTIYASNEDQQLANRIKEMEIELSSLRADNNNMTNHIVELKAQLLHAQSKETGSKFIVNLTTHESLHKGPSLADELNKMSDNEIMEKLAAEQQVTERLKEYIDNILNRIMEHSPELLEQCLMRN